MERIRYRSMEPINHTQEPEQNEGNNTTSERNFTTSAFAFTCEVLRGSGAEDKTYIAIQDYDERYPTTRYP